MRAIFVWFFYICNLFILRCRKKRLQNEVTVSWERSFLRAIILILMD